MNFATPARSTAVAAGLALAAAGVPAQEATVRRGFSVEITEPANQSVVLGKTKIAARVKIGELQMLDRVEFLIGDDVIFVDREAPFECTHDFGEQAKSWIIRAIAHHKEEVTVSDAVITRRVPFVTMERVNRVILWVSATDRKGNFLTDLQKDQFRVLENDQPQQILEFYREDRAITLAILLDSSGSMQDKLKEVHQAASSFVDTLRAEDQALVIDFDDKVFLIQDMTSDHEALKEAIESTEAIGGTAIYDGLHAAYRKIGKLPGRKAIVLLSDGEDTSSQFGFKRILEEAKVNNTIIYTIGLGGGLGGGARKSVLREFAEVTGGRAFFVTKAEQLGEVYQQIAEELRAQFYLAYSTNNENWDGRWIKIRVQSGEPGVEVRARSGYFAVRSAS